MQTLGAYEAPERYTRLSVKVRILREIKRRLESAEWRYKTVTWSRVVRTALTDDFDPAQGPTLSVRCGLDEYGTTATKYQNRCTLNMDFALIAGENEEPEDVLNLIAADLVEVMAGDHHLEEGGKGSGGDKMACGFYPQTFEDEIVEGDPVIRGYLTWEMRYRTGTHRPYDPA